MHHFQLPNSRTHTHIIWQLSTIRPASERRQLYKELREYGKGSNTVLLPAGGAVWATHIQFSWQSQMTIHEWTWTAYTDIDPWVNLSSLYIGKSSFEGQKNLQESLRGLQEKFRWPGSLAWPIRIQQPYFVHYIIHTLKCNLALLLNSV